MIIFCSLVDSCCSNRRKLSEESKRKLEKLLNKKKLKANDRIVRRFCERPPRPPSTGSGTCCKYPISGRVEVLLRKQLMQNLTKTMFKVVGDREGMMILAKICLFAGHLFFSWPLQVILNSNIKNSNMWMTMTMTQETPLTRDCPRCECTHNCQLGDNPDWLAFL